MVIYHDTIHKISPKKQIQENGFHSKTTRLQKAMSFEDPTTPLRKKQVQNPSIGNLQPFFGHSKKIVLTSSLVLFDYLLINLDSLVGAVDCRSPPTPLHSAHLRDGTRASPKPNGRSDPATSRGSHPGPTTPRIRACEGVGSTLDHHGLVVVADFGGILGIGLCEYPMSM